jgi:myo-inositol-1(or 4)-monophosphatase
LKSSTTTSIGPATFHPALLAAAEAASRAWRRATTDHDRHELIEAVADGADGTPSSRLDDLVETAILEAVDPLGVNVLSEEAGWLDRGSAVSLIIDPVDGTGNAAAGVPIAAFTAAIATDERFVEGLTVWLDTGRWWWAERSGRGHHGSAGIGANAPGGALAVPATAPLLETSGRTTLEGAIVSMIRPKEDPSGFLAIAGRADRVRILGSSAIEAALVAQGSLDAAIDAGSRTHRIVDLAAAVVLLGAAGGIVTDVHGRPVEFTTEIAGRWSGVCAASQALADEVLEVLTHHS